MTRRRVDNLNADELNRLELKEFFDVNDLGELFGCSPWTVRLWERQGKIKGIRLSGLLRFERSAVVAFINAARV